VLCALCSVLCALCSVLCALCSVLCAPVLLCSVQPLVSVVFPVPGPLPRRTGVQSKGVPLAPAPITPNVGVCAQGVLLLAPVSDGGTQESRSPVGLQPVGVQVGVVVEVVRLLALPCQAPCRARRTDAPSCTPCPPYPVLCATHRREPARHPQGSEPPGPSHLRFVPHSFSCFCLSAPGVLSTWCVLV
jgi:hypothetical protein